MPTPSGDVTIDFTVLANTNPYTPSNFARATSDTVNLQIISGTCKPVSPTGALTRFMYQGAMDSSKDVISSIEVGVAHVSDNLFMFIGDKTSGQGYMAAVNSTSIGIYTVLANGTTGGLTSGSVGSITSGDVFAFTWNHTTHNLAVTQNGTAVINVTDSTYTSGLTFGLGADGGNTNTSTMLGFGGTGILASGNVPFMSYGFQPTVAQ